MKRTILLSILILFFLSIYAQDEYCKKAFISKYKKKEHYYQKKGIKQIKNILINENIYNFISINSLLKNVEYLFIPMFEVNYNDTLNYLDVKALFSSLKYDNKNIYSSIIMFKDNKYFGTFDCTDIGENSVNLKEVHGISNRIPNLYYQNLISIENLSYEYIFYIKGVLHTFWLINEKHIFVIYLPDNKVYDAESFLNNFYTNEKLKFEFKFIYDLTGGNK